MQSFFIVRVNKFKYLGEIIEQNVAENESIKARANKF